MKESNKKRKIHIFKQSLCGRYGERIKKCIEQLFRKNREEGEDISKGRREGETDRLIDKEKEIYGPSLHAPLPGDFTVWVGLNP